MPENPIFTAEGVGSSLPYAAQKEAGTRQGFQIPRAWTAMKRGQNSNVQRCELSSTPSWGSGELIFHHFRAVNYQQKGTIDKTLAETCSFPKKAHSQFSDSGNTNTSSFTACQFLLKSLSPGSRVLRKYLGGLEACWLLS